jgi:hypothetical protein
MGIRGGNAANPIIDRQWRGNGGMASRRQKVAGPAGEC